jgi:hypothetical protein
LRAQRDAFSNSSRDRTIFFDCAACSTALRFARGWSRDAAAACDTCYWMRLIDTGRVT